MLKLGVIDPQRRSEYSGDGAPGRSRGLEHDADARILRACTSPVKCGSRPATIRSKVDLPQPDGPISTVMLWAHLEHEIADGGNRSVRARVGLVLDADVKPACCASGSYVVQGAAPEIFDCEHDGDEGDGVAENRRHVEELKVEVKLEAYAVRAPEQLDHETIFQMSEIPEREAAAKYG